MMNAQNEPMTFEQAMARLEAIVRTLESGELPLDETVRLYEEGQRLRKYCEQCLADAQQRIDTVRQDSAGNIILEQLNNSVDEELSGDQPAKAANARDIIRLLSKDDSLI